MSGGGTRVHESAFVGPGVELGVGVVIAPQAVLLGPTQIGDRVRIGTGAHVGGAPEISSARQNEPWDGDLDHHDITIGADSVLRDGVVIHHGSVGPTVIGQRCWIFSRVYIAHDVLIGDDVTLSAGTGLGGHVTVRRGCNLGLNVSVHQRRTIGAMAMIGMGTPVTRDVPPFTTVYGVPARVRGINRFGMERFAVPVAEIEAIERVFGVGDANTLDGPTSAGVASAGFVGTEITWWGSLAGRMAMSWEGG